MGFCNNKSFFNRSTDSDDLAYLISDSYWDTQDLARSEKKKFTTQDFYNTLVSKLKSEDTPFMMEYSSDLTQSQKSAFKKAFGQIKDSIIDLIPNEFRDRIKISELRALLDNNLQDDLGAGRLKIVGEDEDESFNIEAEGAHDDDTPIRELKFRDFIEQTYGGCIGAVNQMKHIFSREIFTNTLCNFERGTIVTNNTQLNDNIALYKNQLLQRVTDLLHEINPETDYPTSIYTESGNVHLGYYKVLSDMREYLESIKGSDTINEEYNKNLFGNESTTLNAIHAYTILKYFDSLLQESIGKTIKFNKLYKNQEVTLDVRKYAFSKDTEHQRKSWTDSENRTAIQNSSRFSKFVLDSIPLIVNGKDTGKNIGQQFYMTMTKLFSNVSILAENDDNSVQDLVQYIYAFHGSPTLYSYKIINLINSSSTVQDALRKMKSPDKGISIQFTDNDFGVIQSLYKYVFSYDTDMNLKSYANYKNKSIRSMEYNQLKTSYNLGKYSILSDLVSLMDDVMASSYIYSEYGPEGGFNIQRRVLYKDRRGSEKFKDTINAANISYSQLERERLKTGCQVEFETSVSTQKATVTIPISVGNNKVLSFDVVSSSDLGILGQKGETSILKNDESPELLDRLQVLFGENSPIDLSSAEQRARLLADGVELTPDEQLFKQVLQFIDDRLKTRFLIDDDGLRKLHFYKTLQLDSGAQKYYEDLLVYAVRSQVVSNIYYDFNARMLDPNDRIKSRKQFLSFVERHAYPAFANLSNDQKKVYYITNNGITNLRTLPSSTQWVDVYDQATLILYGENMASTSKNQSGNNDANYVTSFLGGQIFNVLYKARQTARARQVIQDRALGDITEQAFMMANADPEFENLSENDKNAYLDRLESQLEEGVSIPPQTAASKLLFTNNSGAVKQCVINSDVKNRAGTVKSLRDLKTSELFYNAIIHNFWSSFVKTGEYCIQPTTYSDKVKLIQYMIDGKNYHRFGGKSLSQLTKDETIELYRSSIGEASKLALDNVIYTYEQLWGEKLTLQEINRRLKNYTEDRLVKEAQAKGLRVQVDLHYRVKKINGKEALLVSENLAHEAKYADAAYLRNKFAEEEVKFINQLVNSGVLFYVDYHDTSLYDRDFSKLSVQDQLRKSSNPIANIITSLYTTEAAVEEYANKWIKNGKLVLAYDKDGKAIQFTNTNSVSEINPLFEKYFYIDSLVSNNLRLSLTGFETNHPDKSKFVKMWNNVAKANKITNKFLASSKEIGRLQKAQIIWGHPALGKTTYLYANPDSIIEWDNEFNPIRNKFIADTLGNDGQEAKQQFLFEAQNYITGSGEYNASLTNAYEQYKQMLIENWELAKQKARSQGKKLFASPAILPILFRDDFDLFLTMDEQTFLQRKPNGLDWKQSIDRILNSDQSIIDKTINVGNLYMSDIMALNDSFDLYSMSLSNNPEMQKMADSLSTIIENVSQGTQLKRNVIIPATLHYMHNDLMNGVTKKIKVAIIKDMPAQVFNFRGDTDKIDSMDGSAFTTALQSILENMSLGSQEVGPDKKPIWHHYDQETGTAALMKFASFEINNERMLLSMNSRVPLIRMYKKMTNMQWSTLDENGVPVQWNTSVPIELGKGITFGGINRSYRTLKFQDDILDGRSLYYRDYAPDGSVIYKQIVGFGGNSTDGYYTIESYVDEYGDVDVTMPQNEQVYHWFNSNSDHHTTKQEGDHTINSLYELWQSLGGVYSQELGEGGTMTASESSHYAVVGFMNKTVRAKNGAGTDRFDVSQNSYEQPLKDMMIGYLTNNSGMKNGAANRNSVNRWFDEEPLTYMEMDSDGLGIQMDADHDVEEAATMTEFSQVISALEAGGFLHKYAKQVYSDLGRVAAIASQMEIDAVTKFLAGEESNYDAVKDQLYDVLGRTLLNGVKSRDDSASLTDSILRAIEKSFNKNLNHKNDIFKIPFSDSNIYSQILPTLVSIINKKSIKRKYPGSGCVMIPGYNVIQYFNIGGSRYTFNDLVRMAFADIQESGEALPQVEDRAFLERTIVQNYLNKRQSDPSLYTLGVEEYIPTDVVDVMSGDEVLGTITLDELKTYYKFKDQDWSYFGIDGSRITRFRYNIRQARNLAPVKITFETETGRKMNVFDLPQFRQAYENPSSLNREAVSQQFLNLDKGFYIDENGRRINIKNLNKSAAELVISNMYKSKFGIGDKSVAQIREQGVDAFRTEYESPKESKYYDMIFTRNSGDGVYISFESPKKNPENTYEAYDQSKLITERDNRGNIDVFLISEDNRKQFKVGRYVLKTGYTYKSHFTDADGNDVSEADALKVGYIHSLGSFYDATGSVVSSNEALKNGFKYESPSFYDNKGKKVTSKEARNLRADNSTVYEYVEFVSRYRVAEKFNDGDDVYHINEYEKYYINTYNAKLAMGITDDPNKNSEQRRREQGQLNTFIANILDDIYATQQFSGIQVNPTLTRNAAASIVKYAARMENVDWDFKQEVLNGMIQELNRAMEEPGETISIEDKLIDSYNKYYDKLAQERYSSWEQSLYFTAARIPAQTLQSFMQMEAIAYSGNSRNIVYVSHWQAWLQGSDYDIDKAYIMGQEFGDDGRLVKWSNLFDYSSPEMLRTSLWLPTPRKVFIDNNSDTSSAEQMNINRQLADISYYANPTTEQERAARLGRIANLIIDIYDYMDRNNIKDRINLVYDEKYSGIAGPIIDDIIKHERTTISPNLEESAYKNSISANIRNIVQDLKNMNLAYSPITMSDLQDLAADSPKGAMTASMSLINPLTKYIMQVQNMVGKKVIGIAAVAEKVFFNLSYYYNEGVRSGNEDWIRNMQFSRTFNRIQNRYNGTKLGHCLSDLQKTIKSSLANVNFYGYDYIRSRFITINQIVDAARKKFNITDSDIENHTGKWEQYNEEVESLTRELSSRDQNGLIDLHRRLTNTAPVDLMISQILSAATDNAKELILAKINCGDNLAGCHLYLLMLGFDIKDVVTFMTSPCVNLINDLSEANMMDSYIPQLRVQDAIKIAKGIIDSNKFLPGSVPSVNEYGERDTISRSQSVLGIFTEAGTSANKAYNLLVDRVKQINPDFAGFNNLQDLIQQYINARLDGEQLEVLENYAKSSDYETEKGIQRLSDYIEKIIYSLQKTRSDYGNREDFDKDLAEFEEVYQLANETTTLGGPFLGLNQGLPGSKVDLQSELRKIKSAVTTRENLFNISAYQLLFDSDLSDSAKKSRRNKFEQLLGSIQQNNSFIVTDINPEDTNPNYKDAKSIIMRASALGIINNFDVESWLYDRRLTADDIITDNFLGEDVDINRVMEGNESLSYREVVSDYYNLIKGTWNIFDIINRIPQYREIINLLKTVYVFDKHTSAKSNLTNVIYDKVYETTNFIDENQNKAIIKYVDDLLVTSFFRDNNFSFPIYENMEYLDTSYKTKIARFNQKVDLNNAPGRAAFKKVFESILPQLQRNGRYGDVVIPDYKNNAFLQGLKIVYDKYEVPTMSTELDMMRKDATPNSQRRFQEYLNGLNSLKDVIIGGVSLSDWFMLYNLYVNQNSYGSDKLTTMFKNSLINRGSILETYFKYIGNIDYNNINDDVLQELGYNLEDLLIRTAPYVSRSQESASRAPYIRTTLTSGELVYKKKSPVTGAYRIISIFPDKDLRAIDDSQISEDQKSNYQQYQMMPMKNQDFNVSLREGLMSTDINVLVDTLITYSRKGILEILKENC